MCNERQETIEDIITEARGVFDELSKHGYNVVSVDSPIRVCTPSELLALRKHGYNVVSVDRMEDIIDRVEEAHKREREAGAEAAQICGEIGEIVGLSICASNNH